MQNELVMFAVSQGVSGLLFLVGFVALMRRQVDKEIPAKLTEIKDSLEELHRDVERVDGKVGHLENEFIRATTNFEARIRFLEGRQQAPPVTVPESSPR